MSEMTEEELVTSLELQQVSARLAGDMKRRNELIKQRRAQGAVYRTIADEAGLTAQAVLHIASK